MCFLLKKWSISLDPPLLHINSFRERWCTSSLLTGLILMREIYLQLLEGKHKKYISHCHGILDSGLWIVPRVERLLLTQWQTPLASACRVLCVEWAAQRCLPPAQHPKAGLTGWPLSVLRLLWSLVRRVEVPVSCSNCVVTPGGTAVVAFLAESDCQR